MARIEPAPLYRVGQRVHVVGHGAIGGLAEVKAIRFDTRNGKLIYTVDLALTDARIDVAADGIIGGAA